MELSPIQQWSELAEFGGYLIAFLAGVFGWLRWVWPRIKSALDSLAAVAGLPEWQEKHTENHAELDSKINTILRKVEPNGWHAAVKEGIARIERQNGLQTELLRAYSNHNDHPMFEADAKGAWLWCNELLQRWLGKGQAELLGYGWVNCLADALAVRAGMDRAVIERREFRDRVTMLEIDGMPFATDWHVVPVLDEKREVHRLVGNMRKRGVSGMQPVVRIPFGEDNGA